MIVGVIVAAGSGTRLGAKIPKALVPLCDVPLIIYSLDTWSAIEKVHQIIVVVPQSHYNIFQQICSAYSKVTITIGGAERSDSVAAGIQHFFTQTATVNAHPDNTYFLIHDAARALTPPEVIYRVIAALEEGASGVVPVLPVVDTIKLIDSSGFIAETIPRHNLVVTQTPQGFPAEILQKAYQNKNQFPHTDDAGLVEKLAIPITTVPGHFKSLKITTPLDLLLAAQLLTEYC